MKRFFATTAITALLVASLSGCSKEKNPGENNTDAPTGTVNQNGSEDNSDINAEYITLGGYFLRDNANLTIFISDSQWRVNGILFPEETGAAPLILSSTLTYTEGLDLVYSENGEEMTFTFAANSMTIQAKEGDTYAAFAGTYRRVDEPVAEAGTVSPKSGSTLELLGRIAATHYMAKTEGIPACTFDIAANSFDNNYMVKFVLAYADLFLSAEALPLPEISDRYLCYAFPEEELNKLLLTATAGTFDTADFDTANTDIVYKEGIYYVPCYGNYACGLATSYTGADPEVISERLLLEAVISKMDGTRYDIEMTLSTSENTAIDTVGIQINSVTYEMSE
ncbi:MAG: hypothetical protein ACI4QX_07985 [Lachnospiraceae bacterium]